MMTGILIIHVYLLDLHVVVAIRHREKGVTAHCSVVLLCNHYTANYVDDVTYVDISRGSKIAGGTMHRMP